MNFFKNIEAAGVTNAEIKIVEKNGKYSVSFVPKYTDNIPALSRIKPLVMKGTAEEIDQNFFDHIIVFTDNPEFKTNYEEAQKAIAESAKEMAEKKKKDSEKPAKTPSAKKGVAEKPEKEEAPAPEKPKPESKFKKYEDAVLVIVEQPDFKIGEENYSKLKDAVDMLSVMDKNSELSKEWEGKLKIYKAEKSSLFAEVSEPKKTVAPPPPPADDEDDSEEDFDFDPFEDDNGPTGHGDICESDADSGL